MRDATFISGLKSTDDQPLLLRTGALVTHGGLRTNILGFLRSFTTYRRCAELAERPPPPPSASTAHCHRRPLPVARSHVNASLSYFSMVARPAVLYLCSANPLQVSLLLRTYDGAKNKLATLLCRQEQWTLFNCVIRWVRFSLVPRRGRGVCAPPAPSEYSSHPSRNLEVLKLSP